MVAIDRHAAENNFRLTRWRNLALFQVIAKDPVINFSIEPMLIEGDACTAAAAFFESLPKADVQLRQHLWCPSTLPKIHPREAYRCRSNGRSRY